LDESAPDTLEATLTALRPIELTRQAQKSRANARTGREETSAAVRAPEAEAAEEVVVDQAAVDPAAGEVVVVPDQDAAGMKLVDRALELGWSVSMPEWPTGVKDVNDAVIKLGRLGCLITIMQAKETSRIKIEMRRKQIVKKLCAGAYFTGF
jgi:hypothetical protein